MLVSCIQVCCTALALQQLELLDSRQLPSLAMAKSLLQTVALHIPNTTLQHAKQDGDVSLPNGILNKVDELQSKSAKGAGTDSSSTQHKHLATTMSGSVKLVKEFHKELDRLHQEIKDLDVHKEANKSTTEPVSWTCVRPTTKK